MLAAEHAPLVASFLLRVFIAPNGFDVLKGTSWLQARSVYYRSTLMAHVDQWGHEPQPSLRDLPRLTQDERAVFDELRDNRLRQGLRLEQERIGFGWLLQALAALPVAAPIVLADPKGAN